MASKTNDWLDMASGVVDDHLAWAVKAAAAKVDETTAKVVLREEEALVALSTKDAKQVTGEAGAAAIKAAAARQKAAAEAGKARTALLIGLADDLADLRESLARD